MKLEPFGLYDPADEHDACGVGMVAAIDGAARRDVVERGVAALKAVFHRGALNADGKTGDGAGVRLQIAPAFFDDELTRMGKRRRAGHALAVGMMFLPRKDREAQEQCRVIAETEVMAMGYTLLGWRQVPVDPSVIGFTANETRPEIAQLLIECPKKPWLLRHGGEAGEGESDADLRERDLYLLRKRIERKAQEEALPEFYICSLSSRDVIYKGLFRAEELDSFYPDLADHRMVSSYIIFHQRFSTNTAPVWHLAQPFRTLAHNGEINTVQGNVNWMRTHESAMRSPLFGEHIEELKPVVAKGASDTAALDAAMELLVRAGRPAPMAKTMLVPPAWTNNPTIPHAHRALFSYCNSIMSPWDGPAALAVADGNWIVAGLDRNGLRPMRYKVTDNGLLCVGSESGMVPLNDCEILEAGRLGPGEIIGVDLEEGTLYRDQDLKTMLATRQPFEQWAQHTERFEALEKQPLTEALPSGEDLLRRQWANGMTREDLDLILRPMVVDGKEGIGSMGDDTPMAVLSKHYRGLHHFFRQRFSQVTNPPIDSLRERQVMSLTTRIGNRQNILAEDETQTRVLQLKSPVVLHEEWATLMDYLGDKVEVLDTTFELKPSGNVLRRGIDRLLNAMDHAYEEGKRQFVLTDRAVDAQRASIPMILAVAACHSHMVRRGIRKQITLLVQSSECFDVHHTAVLIGVGSTLVHPWLAEACIEAQHAKGVYGELSLAQGKEQFRTAIGDGLLKIMAKMGISVISSYRGGTIFEIIGLSRSLVATFFPGMTSRISGIGLKGIEQRVRAQHARAWESDAALPLPVGGYYAYRANMETHAYDGQLIHMLQQACDSGRYQYYKRYSAAIHDAAPVNLRDLMDFDSKREPIPLEQVEPVTDIRRRFVAPAMSLGALSPEAHETLAIAMNRIGAMSNSGEGGEGAERQTPRPNGDNANSRIKQVASGRFGVTADYLNHADEIQIKVAQGAKPGEGGQLPGFKVTAEIARLRHSTPGVMLISPPPHHDIYSIEDLAQLIYDLKQINPDAKVSVKLVAQAGVGTIASGVAKAMADKILISGHSGGTGASALSSIKHAGSPWELGLAEANQVLTLNRLRHRVTLQTDGGLKTGRDIVMAALLGAEEYGIGTLSLVAMGCLLVRQCHSNTCPVGICTQDPKLRAKFDGSVEKVINLVTFIAEEVREILAQLGYRSLDEVIGRTDLLKQVRSGSSDLDTLDLGPVLVRPDTGTVDGEPYPRICTIEGRNVVDDTLDQQILEDVARALETGEKAQLSYTVRNTQRSIGTALSSMMVRLYDTTQLNPDHITVSLRGTAGQSLGAFAVRGLRLEVTGDANDYVGKGLSGAVITLKPRPSSRFDSASHTIIGNTCLYGATKGELYAAGQAGERFAVRNSGAIAVVEGAGTNACEYMTGGAVIILGPVGLNFGAGMTGGMAFVYDPDKQFPSCVNPASVTWQRLESSYWEKQLKDRIQVHRDYTQSRQAQEILARWDSVRGDFWQICPKEMIGKLEHPLSDSEPPVMQLVGEGA